MEKTPEERAKSLVYSSVTIGEYDETSLNVGYDELINRIAAAIREAEERGAKNVLGKIAISDDKGGVYERDKSGSDCAIFNHGWITLTVTLLPA